MNWLCRLGWRPRLRPASVIRIIENWVCLVVVVEQRPSRPDSQEPINWQGNRPPKRLKGKRHRRRSRNRHPRYNPPY
mgnify:CR=1 FL=1